MEPQLRPACPDRTVRAVEKVRERLLRAATALETAGIPYAVVGGNAVAAWVSRVDGAAVRNAQGVDILLRRADLPAATVAAGSGRLKDQVHLQDLFDVGLIDASWPARFLPELAARLQAVLDNPDG